MRILITGAFGFIGKNLVCRLAQDSAHELILFGKNNSDDELKTAVARCEFIFHLAGSNRPVLETEFTAVNAGLTARIAELVHVGGKHKPIVFTSSTQAADSNPYGKSKLAGERALLTLNENTGNPICIYRLPNVFGKWCRPNYNSVVATFCYNISKSLPIAIHDPDRKLILTYIDDIINTFRGLLENSAQWPLYGEAGPVHVISLGDLARQIQSFRNCRDDLVIERVGCGLTRALYATYLSYINPQNFSYSLLSHSDARGIFVEVLKTHDSGQFSYFTAGPGVTRGGHYHHSKSEKFLVVKGHARFRFKHVQSGECHHLFTTHDKPEIVETVPGWAHDITNVGNDEMIVLLWANERFDRNNPDTYAKVIL